MTTKSTKNIAAPAVQPIKAAEETSVVAQTAVEPPAPGGTEKLKGYEDLFLFSQENIEALLQSANALVHAIQDFSTSVVSLARGSIEESVAAGKALAEARTFQDVIDLSSSLARANFDKLVTESRKLGELSSKLAEDAIAPLNKRVDAAVQTLTKIAA